MKDQNNKKGKIELDNTTTKEVWNTPTVIDLDVDAGTMGATSGPSVNDGGPGFSDYNS